MECPPTHEWYELERSAPERTEADRLRRHVGECAACRDHAGETRDLAAALERLAERTRVDLTPAAAESVLRRARVHGYVGRRRRRSWTVRLTRSRWVRLGLPMAAAVAGAILIVVGLQISGPQIVLPQGALARLARAVLDVDDRADLKALAPVARAAVSEELARSQPASDQVGDLLLVAYITQRPLEDRQVNDVRFLVSSVFARRADRSAAVGGRPASWPMLASVVLAQAAPAVSTGQGAAVSAPAADPMAVARGLILAGDYAGALAVLPADASAAVLRGWCLALVGRSAEAAKALTQVGGAGPMARLLQADLALQGRDVAEALRQYETLADGRDRYWFAAGYLCRYELADARDAGLRFQRIRDPELSAYVARQFAMELAAAQDRQPTRLFAEDFDGFDLGVPEHWALVLTREGEFRVVSAARGKVLEQDEVDCRGAEFVTGRTDWADYTLQVDVKLVASHGDYTIGASAYRRSDQTGYVLELSQGRLRLVKQFAAKEGAKRSTGGPAQRMLLEPVQAQMRFDEPPARDWWYTLKIRVQQTAEGVSVAGKYWRTDTPEPLGWQVVWTDTGQGGVEPLEGGLAGVQVSGAKVQIDNLVITRNESPKESVAAAR